MGLPDFNSWEGWGEAPSASLLSERGTALREHAADTEWHAIYTWPNQEKHVNAFLRERGFATFLPTYESVRRRTDRRVLLELPLFPSYVFIHMQRAERLRVLQVPRVVRIVGTATTPAA